MKNTASLFGQKHSNRDYSKKKYWGKNQFNSSFPASLVAYMSSINISPVYLKMTKKNILERSSITGSDLFGIDPLSDDADYRFEMDYYPYGKYYTSGNEKIDLVMHNRATNEPICGLEIKLMALPDNTTERLGDDKYSCEIVVRPPTICSLACSMCYHYDTPKGKTKLLKMLLKDIPKIKHWDEASEVAPHYDKIKNAVMAVAADMSNAQTPLIIQPVWKTNGKKSQLADDCLDVFVWSNLATILMCCAGDSDRSKNPKNPINRFQRAVIWIYKMLDEFAQHGKFDYTEIVKQHSYGNANDKAFSLPGKQSYQFLKGPELSCPRIKKDEIKKIILGGGQNFLSPERRFDAVIVNSPNLFDN